jgi:hypothetical protein
MINKLKNAFTFTLGNSEDAGAVMKDRKAWALAKNGVECSYNAGPGDIAKF